MTVYEEGARWRDVLPASCPPLDAQEPDDKVVLRLIPEEAASPSDMQSGATSGRHKPRNCDDCTWCACSVWEEETKREKLADLAKLPNLSDMKYIARVRLKRESGVFKPHEKDPNHLKFWVARSFSMVSSVEGVEPI